MLLELTSEEKQLLLSLLEEALPELRVEIRRTDDFEMREALKQRESLLHRLRERLEAAEA